MLSFCHLLLLMAARVIYPLEDREGRTADFGENRKRALTSKSVTIAVIAMQASDDIDRVSDPLPA